MTTVAAIVGGSAGAALIQAFYGRWKYKAVRQAAKEDREEEKNDKTEELEDAVHELEEHEKQIIAHHDADMAQLKPQIEAQSEALRLILLDKILTLGEKYIARGEITYDERKRFHAMHNCYHNGLGGNGDADLIVEAVDELPLKTRKSSSN